MRTVEFTCQRGFAGTRPTVNGGHLPRLAVPQTAAATFNVVF